jgi:hypothetical protein
MGYVGHLFTWRRGKIRERLDRGVVNDQWNILFPFASLNKHQGRIKGPKRFEARWLQEEEVENMVKVVWERAKDRGEEVTLMQKLW